MRCCFPLHANMESGHNQNLWLNSLSSLISLTTTASFESQGNNYLSQSGISWFSQQALAVSSPYQASLKSSFVFGAPHSPHWSESSESSTCLNSRGTSQSQKRTPWTKKVEEEILIGLCREHKSTLKGSGSSTTWLEIAERLNKSSNEINTCSSAKTGTDCKDKWHNLLNAYKKAKDSSTKTGGGTKAMKAFRHFEQCSVCP